MQTSQQAYEQTLEQFRGRIVPRNHPAHQMVERFDKDMCCAWKDEIDKLLISVREPTSTFVLGSPNKLHKAGLFSAAITAFAVESY